MDKNKELLQNEEFIMVELNIDEADVLEDAFAPGWGVFCLGDACGTDTWGIICG